MKLTDLSSIPADFSLTLGKKVVKEKPVPPEWVSAGKPGLMKNAAGQMRFIPQVALGRYAWEDDLTAAPGPGPCGI